MKKWKLLNSEKILSTKWLNIFKNKYQISKDKVIDDYYILKRDNFVLVVALSDSKIILGKQYRPATDRFYWSLPAGYISRGENPVAGAKRELLEETGYKAQDCKLIGRLDPLPGYIQSRAFVVLCSVEAKAGKISEQDEFGEIIQISLDEVVKMIKTGKIDEMQAVAAILLAKEYVLA